MQNLSGQKLGIYELRERLGRGGMAEVYKAYQPGMDRFVAIKIMLGHLADDDTFIERFKREARAVGKLRHPHIINIFDFGIQDDVYYMVMEYLTDGNLKEYIDSQQQLSVQASLKIARDLADALAYAHNAGMIHRDLKPANIMFIDKSKHEVVLTDFGIARILDATGLTGTGMSVGTPAYMSPEAGAGEDTDERADIYALGVILYEMLVGEAPYNADTPLAIIMKHINAPLPTRADYGDKIPEAVERIILRCLAKDADMRFKSAGELRDALDKAIHSSDSTSAQVARVNPVKTSVSSRSSKQTNAMMTDNPTSHMTTIGQSTDEELTKQSSSSPLLPIIGVLVTVIILGGLGFFFFDEFANNNNESTAEETFEDGAFAVWLGGELPPNPEANLSVFSNVSDYLNDAEELAFEGDLDGAIEFIEGILEDELDNADALFARSQLYTYRYDEDDVAGNTARRLIDLQPDSPWGYIALSDSFLNYPAFEDDNAGENALEALEMAHDIEADNPHIIWRLARLSNWDTEAEHYFRAEELGASGASYIYSMGEFLSANSDLDRAIPYWESYVRYTEQETYFWYQAVWYLMESLIFSDNATTAYEYLLELDIASTANNAEIFAHMAFIAYHAGEFEAAQEWVNASLAFPSPNEGEEVNPDTNAARFVQAYLAYWQDGEPDEAIEQLEILAEEDAFHRFIQFSPQADAYLEAARILVDSDRDDDALAYYDLTIEANGGLPFVYEERADVYLELDDIEAAREDLQSAMWIESDPDLQAYYRDRMIELGPAETEE